MGRKSFISVRKPFARAQNKDVELFHFQEANFPRGEKQEQVITV